MKAPARFVAIFSRPNSGRSQVVRAARPSASLPSEGSGAPSHPLRASLLALGAVVFLLAPASPAFAEIIVNLDGAGSGTVVSSPSGINCSNTGGPAGPQCSGSFPLETSPGSNQLLEIKLAAVPNGDSFLAGWSADDPNFFGVATCNSGTVNPCTTTDLGEFGEPPIHVTATFALKPDPPVATTGSSGPGANDQLIALEGAVNPSEFKVSECRFEYGLTDDYGTKLPCVPDASALGEGSADVPVSAEIETELLRPGATYHYRVVASNPGGTGQGQDRAFTTDPAPASSCPNAAIRDGQFFGAVALPECMALEMVSPPHKENQPAKSPSVSASGDRIRFRSIATLGNTSGVLDYSGDAYVASRGSSDWSTAATNAPAPLIFGWGNTFGGAASFTPDFSSWFHLSSSESQVNLGISQAFRAGLGGVFEPLSPLLVPKGGFASESNVRHGGLEGASTDHSHLYFNFDESDPASYLPGDPVPSGSNGGNHDRNVYLTGLDGAGEPSLQLLTRDKADKAWGGDCGARIGGFAPGGSGYEVVNGPRNQGAISPDGSFTYFSTRPGQAEGEGCDEAAHKLRILTRKETPSGPEIEELFASECDRVSPACSTADGDDLYQGASVDQTKVYFTTTRQLADTDLDGASAECDLNVAVAGCDLYLYDSSKPAGERLTQVSAGETNADHEAGKEAKVFNGIAAISGDGSHAYFVATGALTTTPNAEGQSAQVGQPNLYLYERDAAHPAGHLAFIGTADPTDSGLWGEGTGGYPVPVTGDDPEGHQVGGDGHIFTFQSKASLSSDDADGGHIDIYRYDAEDGEILCVSCAPGGPDSAPVDAEGGAGPFGVGTDFAEQLRRVSEDGGTIALRTAESLVSGDRNGIKDSYLWREGQLFRLPGTGGTSGVGAPTLSHDGSTVAFTSFRPLLPQDGDSAEDVYAVRAFGGYPVAVPHVPCAGEACQEPFSAPSKEQGTASGVVLPGNPLPQAAKRCPKGKRQVRRRGKTRCVKQSHRNRHANSNRRAAK